MRSFWGLIINGKSNKKQKKDDAEVYYDDNLLLDGSGHW